MDEILKIKREYKFLGALYKFFKFLKYRTILFLLTEIIVVSGCFYYIEIFCIIYNKSQKSLFINYILSLIEGLIVSLIISIAIVVTRKIGVSCSNNYLYNKFKYIDQNF